MTNKLRHRWVRGLFCVGLLACAWPALGIAAAGKTPPKPPPRPARLPPPAPAILDRFAVNADAAVSAEQALAMKQAGVQLVCFDLNWSTIELTAKSGYSWLDADASIGALAAQGLDILVRLGGNPDWAASASDGPVDRVPVQRYYDFVAAAAERYGGPSSSVRAWEIYNEPDANTNWGHRAAAYAGVLEQAYVILKSATPDAAVVMGGLGYDNFEDNGGPFVRSFLPDLLAAGGAPYLDAVSFHHYNNSSWGSLDAVTASLRATLAAAGVEKPLFWSEGGAPSDPRYGGTPSRQAAYVGKAYTSGLAAGVDSLAWFIFQDFVSAQWQVFTSHGLRLVDGTPKPSYTAYTVAARILNGAGFLQTQTPGELGGNPAAAGYVFGQADGGGLAVAWTDTGTATATWPVAHVLGVSDLYGQPLSYDVTGDQATIALTDSPVYIALDHPCRFRDVPGDFWAAPFVAGVCWQGAVSGYADGTFRPGNEATRGQIAKMVVLGMGWPLDTSAGPAFSDVLPGDVFYDFVETAYSHGIVSGYGDGTFRPQADVSRGQLSKMLTLAKGWTPVSPDSHIQDFSDVPPDHPFYGYIEAAFQAGAVSGYADHTFRPGAAVTRAQLAKMIVTATSH